MTQAEITAFVRAILNESSPGTFWQPNDITAYLQVATIVTVSNLWNLLEPTYKKQTLLSVVAGEREIALPSDCMKPIQLEYAETGEWVPWIPEERFFQWENQGSGNPNGWTLQGGKIYLFPPQIASSLTDYFRLWYMPRLTLAQLPEEVHPLIALEIVISGRAKDESVQAYVQDIYKRYYRAALKALAVPHLQPEAVGEIGRDQEWE